MVETHTQEQCNVIDVWTQQEPAHLPLRHLRLVLAATLTLYRVRLPVLRNEPRPFRWVIERQEVGRPRELPLHRSLPLRQ
eukprot:6195995-Pleurochrysis_carterae.AAC.1